LGTSFVTCSPTGKHEILSGILSSLAHTAVHLYIVYCARCFKEI
jgi:hypothetical protein